MALATMLAPMSQAGAASMAVPLPPLSLTGGAGGSARSDGGAGGGTSDAWAQFDNSGMTVNYAPAIGVGGGSLPSWVWIGALVLGVLWLRR